MSKDLLIEPEKRMGPSVAKTRRVFLFTASAKDILSREAEECLFRHAEVLAEGSIRELNGAASWFGSIMITAAFIELRHAFREPVDALRLKRATERSVRVRARAMRLACTEVSRRLPGYELGTALVETRVRV
ncbi:MAG: hypothetical protein AAF550_05975, partial [Myxococcota bacterium]